MLMEDKSGRPRRRGPGFHGHGVTDRDATITALRARVAELEAELRVLREVRAPGSCECSEDDACRYVRERDAAVEGLRRVVRKDARTEQGLIAAAALRGDDKGE